MADNLDSANQNLERLKFSVTEATGQLTLLQQVLSSVKRALPVDDIRRMDVQYGNLSRTLTATRREIDEIRKSTESLSKATSFYTKETLVQMSAQLKSSTTNLTAFYRENQKLVELFTQVYKRDGPQFLDIFNKLSDRMPVLVARMGAASTSFSTMTEIFKNAGPQGISAYLAAIGRMEKETEKSLDNIDDFFNKFSNSLKNQSIELGDVMVKNLGKIGGGLGLSAENLSQFTTVAGGGIAALGIVQQSRSKLGSWGQDGGVLSRFGGRALGNLPGLGLGLGTALGFGNVNALESPGQAALGMGGAGLAGFSLASMFGASGKTATGVGAIGVVVEAFGQAAQSFLSSRSTGFKDAPGDTAGRVSELENAYVENLGGVTGELGGKFLLGASEVFREVEDFFGINAGGGNIARDFERKMNKSGTKILNEETARTTAKALRDEGIFRDIARSQELQGISRRVSSGSLQEGSLQEAMELARVSQRDISALTTALARGGLSFQEEGNIQVRRQIALQALQGNIARGLAASQLGVGEAQSALQYQQATGGSLFGQSANLRGALEDRLGALQESKGMLSGLGDNPQIRAQILEYDKEIRQIRLELSKISLLQVERDQDLLNFRKQLLDAEVATANVTQASTHEILKLAGKQIDYAREDVGIAKDRVDTAETEADKRAALVQLAQAEAKAQQAILDYQTKVLEREKEQVRFKQSIRGMLGNVGPEGEVQNIKENIELLKTQRDMASGIDRERLQNQIAELNFQKKIKEQMEVPVRLLERQSEELGAQSQIYQTLKAPVGLQAEMKRRELELARQQLEALKQNFEIMKQMPHTAEQMHNARMKVLQQEQKIAQIFDFQRRTFAEMFTEQMLNMPSGSYLNPAMTSQYSLMGPSFRTGASMRGMERGTYQSQIAGIFGQGVDERTSAEQLFGKLLGEGLNINGNLNIDADGRASVNALGKAASQALSE